MCKKTYCLETVRWGRIKVTEKIENLSWNCWDVWRNEFGRVVKTACYESRRIFEEEFFWRNFVFIRIFGLWTNFLDIWQKTISRDDKCQFYVLKQSFQSLLIFFKKSFQKFHRQGSQNWNLRVQTIILMESFMRKTPLSISEFQRKLFVLLEGKLLQLSQNFSVYVQ